MALSLSSQELLLALPALWKTPLWGTPELLWTSETLGFNWALAHCHSTLIPDTAKPKAGLKDPP